MKEILSHGALLEELKGTKRAYLLLYRKGAEQSDCAYRNLQDALKNTGDVKVFVADTGVVRDIHPEYSITSAPALLVFEDGKFKNTIKGCHHPGFFNALFENAFVAVNADPDKPIKSVTVYTTPTCTWCNTLKTYLRKNGIRFNEIDISRDQHAAEELVRRSGQQGVPQTDIEGEIIVGFDKGRLNRLLDIREN